MTRKRARGIGAEILEGLPKTDSIEELARFWDTHDLTEFESELEEVEEPVFERRVPATIPRSEPEE